MSEKLDSQLRTEVDTKTKRVVCQQMNTLLRDVLYLEVQASRDTARPDWIALQEIRMAQMVEKVAPTISNPLLFDVQDFIEMAMSGQAQSLVSTQLPDRDVLVSTVRTQGEQVPSLHSQSSLYETQLRYSLEDTVKVLTPEPDQATAVSPPKVFTTNIKGRTLIEDRRVEKD